MSDLYWFGAAFQSVTSSNLEMISSKMSGKKTLDSDESDSIQLNNTFSSKVNDLSRIIIPSK